MMCSYHKPIDADTGNTVLCISKSMPNHSTVYMLIRTLDHRKMKYTCSILMTNQFLLYVYFQSIISAKMNMLPQSSVTVHVELFNFVTGFLSVAEAGGAVAELSRKLADAGGAGGGAEVGGVTLSSMKEQLEQKLEQQKLEQQWLKLKELDQ